ncbi:transposase, partial [Hymenobacter elongatus]
MQEARRHYVQTVVPCPDVAWFHFLDETGLDQCRRYARARGGRRVGQAVPLNRGRSRTLIGALSVRGLHGVQVLSAPLTQRSFALYIARILAPQLRRGDVLVLGNLRVHHLTGLRQWLGKRGVEVLFLPPYSPDFSPIEQAWSKLKTKLRAAQARTEQALKAALHEAIAWISSPDARHWFAHCGYHVP